MCDVPTHQYRGDNKSPVSQRVGHVVILVSVVCQVHSLVGVPHSNLECQTGLSTFSLSPIPLTSEGEKHSDLIFFKQPL